MIVVRNTNQAKYGMGDELLKHQKEMLAVLSRDPRISGARILTDISGPAFTVETEFQVKSLAVFEEIFAELTKGGAFSAWFSSIQPLIDSARREFFTVRS